MSGYKLEKILNSDLSEGRKLNAPQLSPEETLDLKAYSEYMVTLHNLPTPKGVFDKYKRK